MGSQQLQRCHPNCGLEDPTAFEVKNWVILGFIDSSAAPVQSASVVGAVYELFGNNFGAR